MRIGRRHTSADYAEGTNEPPVQEAFAEALRPGQVVFDVGSNVGFYSLIAARLVGPRGEVHAFEAIPECAHEVTVNARRNRLRNVHVHAVAVTDTNGTVELLRSRHPGGATVSADDRPPDFTGALVVPAVSLDGFVAQADVRRPDLVKIDVEGAEMLVLSGMEGLLREARPVVLCEVDDREPCGRGGQARSGPGPARGRRLLGPHAGDLVRRESVNRAARRRHARLSGRWPR